MALLTMIRKETMVLLRSKYTSVIFVSYLLFLTLTVLWHWPLSGVLSLAAMSSQQVTYLVSISHLIIFLAILPGLSGGSMLFERQSGNLHLLQATLISPGSILLGKWIGSAAFVLVLLFSSLPVIALFYELGTLDLYVTSIIYIHLIVTALWASMISLCVASFARSTYSSYMISYGVLLIVSFGLIIPSLLIPNELTSTLRSFSPVGSLLEVLNPNIWRLLDFGASEAGGFTRYLAFTASTAGVSALMAQARIRFSYQPARFKSQSLIDESSSALRRKLRFPFYIVDPQRRRRPIGSWINPIFSREMRSRMLGQATVFLRVFAAIAIISLGVTVYAVFRTAAEQVDSVRLLAVAAQVIGIGLLAPLLTAPAIAREREQNTIELLRLTRVGPVRLVMGQFWYALFISLCFLVAAAPMWFVIYKMQMVPGDALARSICVILVALYCGTAAGLLGSSVARRTGSATATSYALTFLVLFGTLIPLGMSSLNAGTKARLMSISPVTAAVHPVSLSLFRDVLHPQSWLLSTVWLFGLGTLFLVLAVFFTRGSYRVR